MDLQELDRCIGFLNFRVVFVHKLAPVHRGQAGTEEVTPFRFVGGNFKKQVLEEVIERT